MDSLKISYHYFRNTKTMTTHCSPLSLRNQKDLEKLRTTGENRVEWRNLINKLVQAAEAEGVFALPAIQQLESK